MLFPRNDVESKHFDRSLEKFEIPNSKMSRDRVPLKFCSDFGDFVKSYYNLDWPQLFIREVKGVPQVFTTEIGLAIVDKTITRHTEIYVHDINFDYELLLHAAKAPAILYIKEHAVKIKNASVVSLFIMCSFIGSICVFSVEHGHPELVEIPLIALARIIRDEKICHPEKWRWINEVAMTLNRRHISPLARAIEYDPKDKAKAPELAAE